MFTAQKLPKDPIILFTLRPGFRVSDHLMPLIETHFVWLDKLTRPHTFIVDTTDVAHPYKDMLKTLAVVGPHIQRQIRHPNYRRTIYVSPRHLERHMLRLMTREIVGRQPAMVVATLEEALHLSCASGA